MPRLILSAFIVGLLSLLTLANGAERPQGSTLAPKIILAQAGSTGGTIGKQGKSVSGGEETMESPRPKPIQKPRVSTAPPPAAPSFVNVSGRWYVHQRCGGLGNYEYHLEFTPTGDSFKGHLVEDASRIVRSGRVSGNAISFLLDSWEGQQVWTGTVSGTRMSGSLRTTLGVSCGWNASR